MVLLATARRSAPKRILIVDDDEDLRENLAELLVGEGYQTTTASSVSEALERLASGTFDLLLTDFRMPGPSGIDLIKEARRAHPKLRAILMTAFGNGYTEIESIRSGAIGYVRKPFEVEEILTLVARILSLQGE